MQDVHENDEDFNNKLDTEQGTKMEGNKKYHQNLDRFLRTRSEPVSEPLFFYTSLLMEKSESGFPLSGKAKLRKRSLSIPALGKRGSASAIIDPILSGAPQR